MRKTQIALALALAAIGFGAQAQSNVQIYGIADVSVEGVKSTGSGTSELGARSRIQSNSSYIGFRGTEDLGDGLRALFQIETGVNMDDAGTSTFGSGRDTFVGLSSNYGTVVAGYLSHPYRSTLVGMDVVPGAAGAASINGIMGRIGDVNLAARTQAVAYVSPTFYGLKATVAYTGNEKKDTKGSTPMDDPRGYSMSLNYENNGLKLDYAHTTAFDTFTTNVDDTVRGHLLGASYNFGQGTTVGAMFETIKDSQNTGYNKRNSWGLNAKHVMGKHELAAGYYAAGTVKTDTGDVADSKATQVSLRYGYNLSKRTQLYGVYSQINNGSGVSYDFATSVDTTNTNGNDQRAIGVGMRHSF